MSTSAIFLCNLPWWIKDFPDERSNLNTRWGCQISPENCLEIKELVWGGGSVPGIPTLGSAKELELMLSSVHSEVSSNSLP